MKYRRLGKTNLKTSVIGLGTWQFGGEWGKDFRQGEVDAMFDAARETGINLIDTAECYGDHLSEALIGQAIKHDRDQWVLATKFGHKFHSHLNRTDMRTAADMIEQLEGSLKALQTDHVDLLQYHSVKDEEFDNEELRDALEKVVQQGKVRFVGNSISKNTNIHQVSRSGWANAAIIQIIYNRLDRGPEKEVFASCIEQDLGVLARVPLASGYLSGKYKPGATFADNDVRARHGEMTDNRLKEAQTIQETEVPAGVPMAQWALAWCLQHPACTCVIPGCKSVEQVKDNAAAADLDMVADDHRQAWKD